MSNKFQNLAPSNHHLTRRKKNDTEELSNEGDRANKGKNVSHKITSRAKRWTKTVNITTRH